jgi:hypothetical protein
MTATAGDASPGDLLVLPDGLRVRNAPTVAADYRLTVPPTVDRVRVQVGTSATREAPTATRGSAVDTVIALTHGAARDRYTVLLRLAP